MYCTENLDLLKLRGRQGLRKAEVLVEALSREVNEENAEVLVEALSREVNEDGGWLYLSSSSWLSWGWLCRVRGKVRKWLQADGENIRERREMKRFEGRERIKFSWKLMMMMMGWTQTFHMKELWLLFNDNTHTSNCIKNKDHFKRVSC